MKQGDKYKLPNGEMVTILPDDNIKKYDFYANLNTGFIGYCMDGNDAQAMNLVRKVYLEGGFNSEEFKGENIKGLWIKIIPTDEQYQRMKKQYGIKTEQKFPHEK
jgi:predicted small secreted protein